MCKRVWRVYWSAKPQAGGRYFTRFSTLATHHLLLTTRYSSLTTRYSSLVTNFPFVGWFEVGVAFLVGGDGVGGNQVAEITVTEVIESGRDGFPAWHKEPKGSGQESCGMCRDG